VTGFPALTTAGLKMTVLILTVPAKLTELIKHPAIVAMDRRYLAKIRLLIVV
jgi:hypothetical protein